MPPADRRQLRLPFGFFVAHLLLRGVSLLFEPGAPIHRAVSLLALATLLVTIGRSTVLLLLDVILGRRLDRALPKIIRDILQGLVYFLLLLALLREIGLEPGQLLTTSALLTAVIGLSLQDTLGNLVAGLSVQIQRPFSVGDWVQFDADKNNVGRVIEINGARMRWSRSTVVVPSRALAKAALASRPTPTVRRNLFVQVAYEVPPKRVHSVARHQR
jgi:small-conductance mechanosensitive channel